MRYSTGYYTIPISGTVSNIIEVQGADRIGLIVTIPTSCVAYIQGHTEPTSAGFRRISKLDGSNDWAWNVASGNKAIDLQNVSAFPFLRLETSVAQSSAVALTVVTKL